MIKRYTGWLSGLCLVSLLNLVGCQGGNEQGLVKEVQRCPDKRPQICTREYRPVCGLTKAGHTQTYGNACDACADPEVTGFQEGACEPAS